MTGAQVAVFVAVTGTRMTETDEVPTAMIGTEIKGDQVSEIGPDHAGTWNGERMVAGVNIVEATGMTISGVTLGYPTTQDVVPKNQQKTGIAQSRYELMDEVQAETEAHRFAVLSPSPCPKARYTTTALMKSWITRIRSGIGLVDSIPSRPVTDLATGASTRLPINLDGDTVQPCGYAETRKATHGEQ